MLWRWDEFVRRKESILPWTPRAQPVCRYFWRAPYSAILAIKAISKRRSGLAWRTVIAFSAQLAVSANKNSWREHAVLSLQARSQKPALWLQWRLWLVALRWLLSA